MLTRRLLWFGACARSSCSLQTSKPTLRQNHLSSSPLYLHYSSHTGSATRCFSTSFVAQTSSLLTLAIETSCDDTSVAILEKGTDTAGRAAARLHFHEKITSNNLEYRGVHPAVALVSHQQNLGPLVQKALLSLPPNESQLAHGGEHASSAQPSQNRSFQKRLPDFVSVTRGPGMRSNLSVGLDTAKGLSIAWGVPLVAINHMQAHALTPRLVSALANWLDEDHASGSHEEHYAPAFPFLSLLISGGHTLLINSNSLISHPVIAETIDIAVGDYIDKSARAILPQEILESSASAMYGPVLEAFAFPRRTNLSQDIDYGYAAPRSRRESLARQETPWDWSLSPPLSQGPPSTHSRTNAFSFAGLGSVVQHLGQRPGIQLAERKDLAREAMRVVFEHLASRVVAALDAAATASQPPPSTLVVAGGVAANRYLGHILRAYLDAWGHGGVRVVVPPPTLCTDNAAMIAWAGVEMYEAGWRSELGAQPLRRWGLDAVGADGGILGVGSWTKVAM